MSAPVPFGTWSHSFEEDEGDVRVFRPTPGFAFPLSRRGRDSLEFREGGDVVMGGPGADDRHRSRVRRWTALGMNRFRVAGAEGEGEQLIEVVEQTPELLRIRFA